MRILAIDAATEACSVALLQGEDILARHDESMKTHSAQLLAMVDSVLTEAGLALGSLDAIAAGVGPGAFTGVRITVAAVQGLAFGAGLPVVPVTSLEALAMRAVLGGAERVLACLDARMAEVYWGRYRADARRGVEAMAPAQVGPPPSVRGWAGDAFCGIGRGFQAYPLLAALPTLQLDAAHGHALPNARETARLGALRLALGEGLDPAELCPVYLRDKVALTEAERAVK